MNHMILSFLLLGFFLTGCAVGPDYHRPEITIPASYKEYGAWANASPQDEQIRGEWWRVYGDEELNGWVAQVAISNQNVAAATAQYHQAQALLGSARAAYWPALGGSVAETRSRAPGGSGGSGGSGMSGLAASSGAGAGGVPGNSNLTQTARVSLNLTWEVDLWGSIARSVESGQRTAQASQSDVQSALLSAQATLVQTWFQLRATDLQKKLLEQTALDEARSLEITQSRYAAGVASRADLVQANAQLKTMQAQVVDIEVQRAQYEHAIAVLLGKPPGGFSVQPDTKRLELPAVPAIPQALPSRLLERRPDVAAAERRMMSANAQIGVAQAAWFPVLSLGATGGYQHDGFSQLLTAPYRTWSLGPTLGMSLLDGGVRSAQKEGAIAVYDKAVATYRQTVLTAFQEVEDNLVSLRLLAQEAEIQHAATQAAQEAVRLTEHQYRAGVVGYVNVLASRATLLAAQRNDIGIAVRRLMAHTALIKALGGDENKLQIPLTENDDAK